MTLIAKAIIDDESRFVYIQVRRLRLIIWVTARVVGVGNYLVAVRGILLRILFLKGFLGVDQFLVLVQKSLLQLIIGLWVSAQQT